MPDDRRRTPHTGAVEILLDRPGHLSQQVWDAIEVHRQRVTNAMALSDFPLTIGSAKELIESVARVVIEAAGTEVVASNADFDKVVNQAHAVLERQPGSNVTMNPDVRDIASSAKKIVFAVRKLRNDYGTGHGRGQLERIDEEKVTIAIDAAQLWCRWALRRLEHVLVAAAPTLIAALRTQVLSRATLREYMDAIVLPDQPPEIQRALGAAFAQRSMEGTFVAHEAGVQGPRDTTDLSAWPVDFRLGLVEGFTLSSEGFLSIEQSWIPTMIAILAPVSPPQASAFLDELRATAASAGSPNRSAEELHDAAREIIRQAELVPEGMRSAWVAFAKEVSPIGSAET
jgi:hypothetical protein